MENKNYDNAVKQAMEIARKIAEVEQAYNIQMEELMEQMDAIDLDKSIKYEIQEMAMMQI